MIVLLALLSISATSSGVFEDEASFPPILVAGSMASPRP